MQERHGKIRGAFRDSVSAKMLSAVCSAVLAFGMTPVSAFAEGTSSTSSGDASQQVTAAPSASNAVQAQLTYKISGDHAVVSGVSNKADAEVITIPETYEQDGTTYPVTEIDSLSLNGLPKVKSILIPDSITKIGINAFYQDTALESLVIPANVSAIPRELCKGCTSLKSVAIPAGVTSVGYGSFSGCTALESVVIPEGVTSIGSSAFEGCTSLALAWLPSTVESLPSWVFKDCTGLASVIVPEGVTTIGSKAFSGCTGLTSVTLPASATDIKSDAFEGVTGATFTVPAGSAAEEFCKTAGLTYSNLAITTEALPVATMGQEYSAKVESSVEGTTFAATGLPEGLSMASDGTISGTPSAVGDATVTVTATAGDKTVTAMFALSVVAPAVQAQLTFKVSGDHAVVTGVSNKADAEEIAIPATYEQNGTTYPVTEIDSLALANCSKVKSVSIPDGVTKIGMAALNRDASLEALAIPSGVTAIPRQLCEGCTSLATLTIPAGVTSIGNSAFEGCAALGSVAIPDSVTSIGSSAFSGTSLTQVTVPNSLTQLPASIFRNCTSLKDVTLGSGITSVGNMAFSGCTSLATISLPEGVTAINRGAFSGCTGLASIGLPSTLTTLDVNAFEGCTSLGAIEVPAGVTAIGDSAFSGCTSLASATIPASVESIGTGAFSGCTSLTSLTLPEGVKTIGKQAFASDTGLTLVSLPASAETIDATAFEGVTGAKFLVTAGSAAETFCKSAGLDYEVPATLSIATMELPGATASQAYSAKVESNLSYATFTAEGLPEGLLMASDGTISGTPTTAGDVTVTVTATAGTQTATATLALSVAAAPAIPAQLTFQVSGDHAVVSGISNKAVAEEVVIPETYEQGDKSYPVTEIKSFAFNGCRKVTSISIPSSVTKLNGSAFQGCSALTSVNIPESITSLPRNLFNGCSSLTSIDIPSSVTKIDGAAFQRTGLTSIDIPESVTSIGDSAFSQCPALAKVTIPASVTSIASSTFSQCPALADLTLPNGLTSIGSRSFYGCSSLASLTIPATVTSIGASAFVDCTGLTSLIVPEGVTSIGSKAFSGCTGLTSVTLPASATDIQPDAFEGVTGATFTVPAGSAAEEFCKTAGLTYVATSPLTITTGYLSSAFVGVPYTARVEASVEGATFTATGLPEGLSMASDGTISGTPASAGDATVTVTATADGKAATATLALSVAADAVQGQLTFQVSGDHAVVTGVTNKEDAEVIVVPATYEQDGTTYPVTGIGMEAFSMCRKARVISIPDSVTEIAARAFQSCDVLESLSIPSGVTKISYMMCSSCYGLRSIDIPSTVTSIDGRAFTDCRSLESVTIPDSVTSIGSEVFWSCSSLTKANVPDGVKVLNSNTFNSCAKLSDIKLGNSLTTVGSSCFQGCRALVSVDLPASLQTIGSSAFSGCSALASVAVPEGVESLGDSAFFDCSALASATLPNSLVSIGDDAFSKDSLLTATVTNGSVSESYCKDNGIKYVAVGQPAPVVVTLSLPAATVGEAYSATVTCNIADATFSATGLPEGLAMASDGTISGTPTSAGSATVTVTASAAGQTSTRELSLAVDSRGKAVGRQIDTLASRPSLKYVFTITDDDVVDIKAVQAAYDALTPEEQADVGAYNQGTLRKWQRMITPDLLSDGERTFWTGENAGGNDSWLQFTTSVGTKSVELVDGELPEGMSLEPNARGEWYLSGTPTKAGTYHVTLRISTDKKGVDPTTREVTIVVNQSPAIATESLPAATEGQAYSATVEATGSAPESMRWSMELPEGLTGLEITGNDDGTATISGTPEGAAGTYQVPVTVWNVKEGGTRISKTFELTLAPATIDISGATISGVRDTYAATGSEVDIDPVVTMPDGTVLTAGEDYLWEVDDADGRLVDAPTTPGSYTLVVTGQGGYSGEASVPFEVVASRVERLAGSAESGAAGTAAAIAAGAFAGSTADTVVIARNDDYHDALAGSGLAGALGAPILLTDKGGLSQACSDEISELGATKAVILGGPSAITPQVEADLADLGLEVDRLGGADVYGTSMAVNERLVSMAGANADQAIVVNPTTFADALSISGWAYANRVPVMLQTWGDTAAERGFDAAAEAILQGRHLIVCGGEQAVSSGSVSAIDPGFDRLGGDTVYDTSLEIADWELRHGMSAKDVTVASAIPDYDGVDALAGSALAGRAGGVTLLAQSNGAFGWHDGGEAALGFIRAHADEVSKVHVLGGEVASTPALYDAIRAALGEGTDAE